MSGLLQHLTFGAEELMCLERVEPSENVNRPPLFQWTFPKDLSSVTSKALFF